MNTENEMADRLYAETTNEPARPAGEEPQHQPTDPQVIADRPYGEKPAAQSEVVVPENIAEMRAADRERRMYSPQSTYSQITWFEGNQTVQREARELLADVGASMEDARELERVVVELGGKIPTEEQRAQLRAQTEEMLRREYGRDAGAALEAARQLVARDPRWFAIAGILGDSPRFVRKMVDLARREKVRGRL